jgi:hypothetical protein
MDKPRYTAPKADHLAWIHATASDLLKEWSELRGVTEKYLLANVPWGSDVTQAIVAANMATEQLCNSVEQHLPELARRSPALLEAFSRQPVLTLGHHDADWTDRLPKVLAEFQAIAQATIPASQQPRGGDTEVVALTPNEQAFFDVLTDEGQTGPDLVAKLIRQGIRTIDETAISKMAKRPHMEARGVRHRQKAGYYLIRDNGKVTTM